MSSIFYIADPHFCHKGILTSCRRPFDSVDQMDRALLAAWTSRVGPEDTVYILGDLFAYCKKPDPILEQLTGRLILIEGNHDALWLRRTDPGRHFQQVCPRLEITDRDRPVRMTHCPDLGWLPEEGYLLYGHLHNDPQHSPLWPRLRAEVRALNTGVDVALAVDAPLAPATLDEWIAYNRRFREQFPLPAPSEFP